MDLVLTINFTIAKIFNDHMKKNISHELYIIVMRKYDAVKSVHSAESFQSLVSLQFKLSYISSLKELLLIQIPRENKSIILNSCETSSIVRDHFFIIIIIYNNIITI